MKTVLITGGTRGIGRACAERFAAAGWAVTAVARNADRLERMQSAWSERFPEIPLRCWSADLSRVRDLHALPRGPYDVVILNAADYVPGTLTGGAADVYARLLPLNVLANHRLARRVLPPMVERGGGHLVVIGSTGTDHFPEHMTAYIATKYALRGLFLGWEKDLAGTGVLATLVAPGATLTSSWDNEVPPPDILRPETVAERVWLTVEAGKTGRITVG